MDSSKLPVPSKKKRSRGWFKKQGPFPVLPDDSPISFHSSSIQRPKRKCFKGYLQDDCVLVKDKPSIKVLFSMGFFGKSTLTDRTPLACLGPEESAESTKASEKDNVVMSGEDSESDSERHWKRQKRENSNPDTSKEKSEPDKEEPSTSMENNSDEQLVLTFEEAYFLSYVLGVLVVLDKEQPMDLLRMWHKFCELTADNRFPVMYTAYHHLRSKGWVVRSGLKYGVDYVLYKDGPLYYHSTYAVVVKPVKEKNLKEIRSDRLPMTWKTLSALNRVVSHAGKGLLFLYVIRPEMMSENKVATPFCVSKFKIEEVLISRWVPAGGREEET